MNWIVKIGETLDRISGGALKRRFTEAATAQDDDPRATEYRRLTGTNKDLAPLKFKYAQDLSFLLWQRNPLAKRMIGILLDFSVGPDFAVHVKIMKRTQESDEPDVDTKRMDAQKIFDTFWTHPVNRMKKDIRLFMQDLFINGELVLPVKVARQEMDGGVVGTGMVTIGYIDPSNVKEVITEPMNSRIPKTLVFEGAKEIRLEVVRPVSDPSSEEYGKMAGEVFYFRINHLLSQSRGHGDLVDALDWLDSIDQFLFDALEGFRYRNAWFLDVLMKGLSEDELKNKAKDITAPTAGSTRVHNENVVYDVKAPPLQSQDVKEALMTLQTFVVGSKGFPIMWFGTGEDTNRATAGEMSNPTFRMLMGIQGRVKGFIEEIGTFVMDQAVLAGQLKLAEDEYVEFETSMYDINQKDASVIGSGMQQVVTALVAAVKEGWVSPETAKRLLDGMITALGVKVDPGESAEDLLENQKQREETEPYDGIEPPEVPAYGPAED